MILDKIRLSFKIGLLFAILHIGLVLVTIVAFAPGAGWGAIAFTAFLMLLDPFLFILTQLPIRNVNDLIIFHGILGTLVWFFIPFLIAEFSKLFMKNK